MLSEKSNASFQGQLTGKIYVNRDGVLQYDDEDFQRTIESIVFINNDDENCHCTALILNEYEVLTTENCAELIESPITLKKVTNMIAETFHNFQIVPSVANPQLVTVKLDVSIIFA